MKRFVIYFCTLLFCILLSAKTLAVDETVSVTGSIAPKPSDFEISLEPITVTDPVNQDTAVEYRITYGSHLYYNAAITLIASWQAGTILSNTPSSVDIVDYDANSAGAASGTAPVIDLINQKIIWNIPAFPLQSTGATVTYRLKTNHAYTGPHQVEFITKATLTSSNISPPEATATKHYIYNYIAPTATPIPSPSVIPGPSATPGPSTNNPVTTTDTSEGGGGSNSPFEFENISVQTLSYDSMRLFIRTSREARLIVQYGKTIKSLSSSESANDFSNSHGIDLGNLDPDTNYYVRVIATDSEKNTITSSIYIFKTAVPTDIPVLKKNSLIMTSNSSILVDPGLLVGSGSAQLVIPRKQSFEVKFGLDQNQGIKRIKLLIRDAKVLGSTTLLAQFEESNEAADVVELSSGEFIGRLNTPKVTGNYEIIAQIYTTAGSITETKLANMRLTENFKVVTNTQNKPVEAAQVIMYYKNPRTHQYDLLPSQIYPLKNPSYTDLNGEISIALPQGSYLAKVNAIGYGQVEIPFEIGIGHGQIYPHITLQAEPFSIKTLISYYWNILLDVTHSSKLYVQDISNSIRFFEINALIAVAILIFLTLLSFSARLHVPLHSLSDYLWHHGQIANVKKKLGQRIKGRVFDENTSEVLHEADIYLINIDTRKIVAHTQTDKNGDFSFVKAKTGSYDIEVLKEGYELMTFRESEIDSVELGGYLLSIKKRQLGLSFLEKLGVYFSKTGALLFEVLIIFSFIFEVSLGVALGWGKVLPFLIISICNLVLWIIHLSHLRSERNIF